MIGSEYIILAVTAVILLWVGITYNSLTSLVNQTKNAWADIDVQLKRRASLIPNLVEIVKGYAKHEKGVFKEVTKARTEALGAQTIQDKGKAENMLSAALKSLFAVAEAYPDLKASNNFSQLQAELAETENKIGESRRFYNANVRDLNTKIEIIPSSIVAGIFHFQKQEFFQTSTEEKQDVKVAI